jgi:hypothetical protein
MLVFLVTWKEESRIIDEILPDTETPKMVIGDKK